MRNLASSLKEKKMPYVTGDNNYGASTWLVDPVAGKGSHTTIASALTSASSGDTILIRGGTYTENLTLKANVHLLALTGSDQTPIVTIIGKLSASFSGTTTI